MNLLKAYQELFKKFIADHPGTLLAQKIKTVYIGDPMDTPGVNLPALYIEPVGTTFSSSGTMTYGVGSRIRIGVFVNIKDYYWNEEPDVVKIKEELFELMEGRNCNGIAPDTIIGIILANECLKYNDPNCGPIQMTNELQGTLDTSYSYNTGRGYKSREASITINPNVILGFIS